MTRRVTLAAALAVEQLFADAQVGASNFQAQVGGQVAHQPVAKLRVGIAQQDQFVARNDLSLPHRVRGLSDARG